MYVIEYSQDNGKTWTPIAGWADKQRTDEHEAELRRHQPPGTRLRQRIYEPARITPHKRSW